MAIPRTKIAQLGQRLDDLEQAEDYLDRRVWDGDLEVGQRVVREGTSIEIVDTLPLADNRPAQDLAFLTTSGRLFRPDCGQWIGLVEEAEVQLAELLLLVAV